MKNKTITVNVTARDIAEGVSTADACPIALAINRAIGKRFPDRDLRAYVDAHQVELIERTNEDGDYLFDSVAMPHKAAGFVMRFDDKRPVEPFNFTFTLLA